MQLDAKHYFGTFDFYLGSRYAVDAELHSYVVNSATTQPTPSIFESLKAMTVDKYLSNFQCYLTAIGMDKVKFQKRNVCSQDRRQPTIDSVLLQQVGVPTDIAKCQRQVRILQDKVR